MNNKIQEVTNAWAWIRKNNQSIPDDVLDLMKNAAIRELSMSEKNIKEVHDLKIQAEERIKYIISVFNNTEVGKEKKDSFRYGFEDCFKMLEPYITIKKEADSEFPTLEELQPFLYWVFHTADKIYVEHTLGWRGDKAIQEMYRAWKKSIK